MTKKQKILLVVSLALFLVPEILWSTIGNFYYELSQTSRVGGTVPFRYTFLQRSDNLGWLNLVFLLQLIGLMLLMLTLVKSGIRRPVIWSLIVLLGIAWILTVFALYFAMNFSIDIL